MTEAARQTGSVELLSSGQGTGLEVRGVSLKKVPAPETVALLKQKLAEEGVLVFREQADLSEQEQLAFTRALGETQGHPVPGVGGFNPVENADPHVFYLTNAVEGYNPENADTKEIRRNQERAKRRREKGGIGEGELAWHTDLQYMPEPQVYSLLYGIEVPAQGGETEWCNMIRAYAALPEETKERIEGLRAIHWFTRRIPPVTHPVVRKHPISGAKALYVSPGLSRRIEGWDEEEGKALIRDLADHATRSEFCYLHDWRPGDAVLWDNRCTMHRRRGFDTAQRRIVRRTQTTGEPVIPAA